MAAVEYLLQIVNKLLTFVILGITRFFGKAAWRV